MLALPSQDAIVVLFASILQRLTEGTSRSEWVERTEQLNGEVQQLVCIVLYCAQATGRNMRLQSVW